MEIVHRKRFRKKPKIEEINLEGTLPYSAIIVTHLGRACWPGAHASSVFHTGILTMHDWLFPCSDLSSPFLSRFWGEGMSNGRTSVVVSLSPYHAPALPLYNLV